MFKRGVLVVCLTLASSVAAAQSGLSPVGARIRISGSSSYQTQGLMVASTNDAWDQSRHLDGRTLTLPKPGRMITGRVTSTDSTVVTLIPFGQTDAIHVPSAGIARVDVSLGRRGSRTRGIIVGTAIGVAGFLAGTLAGVTMCGSLNCPAAPIFGFATGGLLGGGTGAYLAGERWERTSIDWLMQATASNPQSPLPNP
jgi:hypothetical protein